MMHHDQKICCFSISFASIPQALPVLISLRSGSRNFLERSLLMQSCDFLDVRDIPAVVVAVLSLQDLTSAGRHGSRRNR